MSELGAGPSGSNGVEALQLLEHEQGLIFILNSSFLFLTQSLILKNRNLCRLSSSATTQDNLDDKLRKFEIRDMMGLTDDRDISETVSETWSTDVLGSDFDPNMDEDRLQEIAGTFTLGLLWSLFGETSDHLSTQVTLKRSVIRAL